MDSLAPGKDAQMPPSKKQDALRLALHIAFSALLVPGGFLARQVLVSRFELTLPTFMFFFPAVIFGAVYCGVWVGIAVTLLCASVAGIWTFEPIGQAAIASPSDRI